MAFLNVQVNEKFDIMNQIDNQRMRQITENRLRLKPIVECHFSWSPKYCFSGTSR